MAEYLVAHNGLPVEEQGVRFMVAQLSLALAHGPFHRFTETPPFRRSAVPSSRHSSQSRVATMASVISKPNNTLYVSNIDWKVKKPTVKRALDMLFTRHGKVRSALFDGVFGRPFSGPVDREIDRLTPSLFCFADHSPCVRSTRSSKSSSCDATG